jgi:hypothetical protein
MTKGSAGAATAQQVAPPASANLSSYGLIAIALGMLLLFVLGYLYGNWRSSWEQRMIISGAVAYFADTKLIREGLETDLANVRMRINAIAQGFEKLPAPGAELSKEEL